MPERSSPRCPAPPRDLASGLALGLGALLSVLLMSHHPHPRSHGSSSFVAEVAALAGPAAAVHGGLVAVTVLQAFGFVGWARALGLQRAGARLGLVAYVLGALALVLAALLNGFATPALAARFADAGEDEARAVRVVLRFAWELNQALAGCGVLALAAATLAWSGTCVRLGRAWRWIGVAGLALGAGTGFALLAGQLRLDVHGFGLFVAAQGAWSLAAGVALALGGRTGRPSHAEGRR